MDHVAVLCDLDGVVLDYRAAESLAFAGTATRVGLHDIAAVQPMYAEINHACWRAYERGELTAEELRVRRWADLLAATGSPADPTAVADDYLARLAQAGPVVPGAVAALRRIASQVPVVAVTNGFADVVHGRLAASGTRDLFAGVVVADQVAAPKPHPAMFTTALHLVGVGPDRVVMIGDNHHADIQGAADLGIDTVWIAPGDVEPSPVATWQVATLSAAADLLVG